MSNIGLCQNCSAEVSGAYCPQCGQRQGELLPSVPEWIGHLLDELLFVNKKLPRDLGLLIRRPGRLTHEWVEGRRQQHLQPLRLFLAVALAYLATAPFFLGDSNGMLVALLAGVTSIHDAAGSVAARGDQEAIIQAVATRWSQIVLVVMVPISALWLRALLRRSGPRYVEHLIFSLHWHSFAFLALAAALPFVLLWPMASLIPYPFIVVYLALALHGHYRLGPLRSVFVTATTVLFYVAISFVVVLSAVSIATSLGAGAI